MTLLVVSVPPTDPPITLAGGRSVTECISSNPKPGCSTSRETDGHQLAVLGVMFVAVVFIGWRVVRGVRRGRPQVPQPTTGPPPPSAVQRSDA